MIDEAVAPFALDPALEMSTLRRRIDDPAELAEPERHQGRRRPRRLRAVFFARADSVHARRAARRRRRGATSACTSTAASACCGSPALPPTAHRACRSARTAARARARHPDQGDRNARTTRSASTRRTISSASARRSPRTSGHNMMRETQPNRQWLDPQTRQVHPRHRRRRLLARQGPGGGLDRRAARRPRLQGRAAEVRPVHQRRSRAR